MRLNHVDLIDSDFSLRKDMTILVEGKRICAIGKDFLSVPADEEEYDLEGLTLFPVSWQVKGLRLSARRP